MALDITTDPAQVAVVAAGVTPADTDWITAAWVRTAPAGPLASTNRLTTAYWYAKVTATVNGETDMAWLRFLVGPAGTITLDPAATKVDIWSKITDSPEIPVQKHGSVSIPA